MRSRLRPICTHRASCQCRSCRRTRHSIRVQMAPHLARRATHHGIPRTNQGGTTAGPNLVCSAELACTPQEIADQLARFSVPGQDPAAPAVNNGTYFVTDPRTDLPGGWVTTNISPDGLTVTNTTQRAHVFYDGQIVRSASRADDGSWYVTTHGFGNNVIPGAATVNQSQGPEIFNYMDQQMKANIEAHHGR